MYRHTFQKYRGQGSMWLSWFLYSSGLVLHRFHRRALRDLVLHPNLGPCAMTTKCLDNKICTFKILLSWRFPRKQAFLDDCPLCPQAPPPALKSENFILIVVSPSLRISALRAKRANRFTAIGHFTQPHDSPAKDPRSPSGQALDLQKPWPSTE